MLIAISQTALIILFFTGYWEFFPGWIRWVYAGMIETALLCIFFLHLFQNTANHIDVPLLVFFTAIQLFLLYLLIKVLAVILETKTECVHIKFMFKNGIYRVTDGGNSKRSRMMNYHYHSAVHKRKGTNRSMLYATDIIKLPEKRKGFMPGENEKYPIFGEKIYSPMEGSIFKMVDGIEDNLPFSGNYPYNTGNTIVIRKDDLYFLMGHLQKGSIVVKEGDRVTSGDLLAKAGNSGMSERPHLHMQLIKSETGDYWKGTGVCIRFGNKRIFKNRVITHP